MIDVRRVDDEEFNDKNSQLGWLKGQQQVKL